MTVCGRFEYWTESEIITAGGRHHCGFIIPQFVTHSLVPLKMGKIISRNMLSWLELLISRYCCIYLVYNIIYINDARSSKYQIMKYTECNRRNGPDFGRVFLRSNYTDITQNTYIQSWKVTEIMAGEVWNFDSCYSLIDYQIHIETGRNMLFL